MAAELKDSFSALAAIPWSSVPTDDLTTFIHNACRLAEKLLNSVPITSSPPTSDGTPPTPPTPPSHANSATKSLETLTPVHPTNIDARNASLQKVWGKPLKLAARDNPLNVCVYKTAAHDRHGAWFARRSLHSGVGFTRLRRAMAREFLHSVKVTGAPGAGAVRGIAGDLRLEKREVEGVGKVEAWQLSSAFPGPVTPRGFFELVLSSDHALSEASSTTQEPSPDNIPRHLVLISRPTVYEGATPDRRLVYGTYESVEMIREIPAHSDDPELNSVEWIMITRSDPGGGIPKFMVERGTPGSIVADVPKFIDWVIKQGDVPELDEAAEDAEIERKKSVAAEDPSEEPAVVDNSINSTEPTRDIQSTPDNTQSENATAVAETHGHSSLLGSLTSAVGATVSGYLPSWRHITPGSYPPDDDEDGAAQPNDDNESEDTDDSTSSTSTGTFASAREPRSIEPPIRPVSTRSLDTGSLGSHASTDRKPANAHEKELLKLQERRAALEDRLAKLREHDDKKAAEQHERDEQETAKAAERRERERAKAEARYRREMDKLDERRAREERKAEDARLKEDRRAEERARKARDKDAVLRAQRERDEAREKLDVAARENELMRAQIEELQRENTSLVQKLGAVGEVGREALLKVKEEAAAGRSRASSRASGDTRSSHKS